MIQLKHPELLWALVLLIIPIIIHLFHLRRFKKTPFTNVALLKSIEMNTRKSSQLKKWLILITRLGMLSMLILAFAQPFLPNTQNFNKTSELVVYLDNSFSMEAKGANGSLLNEAKQQLINFLPNEERFTLFTNDKIFINTSKEQLLKDLIDLDYSSTFISLEDTYLKALRYFSNKGNNIKNLIFISDFQQNAADGFVPPSDNVNFGIIPLSPQNTNNIAIDSIYFNTEKDRKDLNISLINYGSPVENVAVALYKNGRLITKASTTIEDKATVQFTVNTDSTFSGKADLLDNGLSYDNRMFFNIQKPDLINVLSINNTNDLFLRKIYTRDEFNYTDYNFDAIEYNNIPEQNLVVLNHLEALPNVLLQTLTDFHENGGSILIIPHVNADLNSYNNLLNGLGQPIFTEFSDESKMVTEIVFDHPLLSDAFYSRVSNFQYPKMNTFFKKSTNRNGIYKLEDGAALLTGSNRVFTFSADITEPNSNFLKSPLIVPALYNMAKQSMRARDLYYTTGNTNTIVLKEPLSSEDIVYLKGEDYSSIPRQRVYGKYVEVQTIGEPDSDGHYRLDFKDQALARLSYNYERTESELIYSDLSDFKNVRSWEGVSQALMDIKSATKVKALWKWFAIFALVLLLLEMLILKYFK